MSDASTPLSVRSTRVRGSAIRDLLTLAARDDVVSLAGGLPSTDAMPADRIAASTQSALGRPGALQYAETTGVRALREVIATRESVRVGRPTQADDVVVTHGSQQALSLLARVLFDPGDVVVVDSPAYTGALQVFSAESAVVVTVPMDADGMDTDRLESRLRGGLRPRLVHTVTNFHNPRGVTMSAQRRRHLAQLSDEFDFWVVEDDPYGEIWFDAPPPPPVDSPRAVRLGSASKILAPALRVGWLVAPPRVCRAVELIKQSADLCGSTLTQLVAADLLSDNEFLAGHLDSVRRTYGSRASAVCEAVDTEFGGAVTFSRPRGGMFVWLDFEDGTDTSSMLDVAVNNGVAYVPGAAFGDEWHSSARLCFTTSNETVLRDAVRRLGDAHRIHAQS